MQDDLEKLKKENIRLKERLDRLEKSDELLRLVMEVPNEGLWDWNPVTKELMISSRLMETLGHKSLTTFTTTHEWLDWVHPDDVAGYESKVSDHLKGLSDHFEWEYRVKDTQGKYHWVLARGKALRDENGTAYRMVGSVGDVTDRHMAVEELKHAHEMLEKRVQERTAELLYVNKQLSTEVKERKETQEKLADAIDEAHQANISKDKHLAAASHDLLQPLNAARLLIATLQERNLGSKDQSLVERVHQALENAEELLIDLLEIAKLDANAISVEIDRTPVNKMLNALEAELQHVAKKSNIELKVMPCSLGYISDPRLLGRILRNYLTNAIRHAHGGRILLGCRRVKDHVRFEVWDNGCGIPRDKLSDIFLEFHQLRGKNNYPNKKGVGLGLAIVERIAKMLAHEINVRSQIGKGSVFSVDVPACEISQSLSPPVVTSDLLDDLEGRHYLVIDNEGSITHSMAVLLQEWGCVPHCALTLRSALMELEDKRIRLDGILADYHLEDGETGLDVIDAVSARLPYHVPAAILTANRSQDLVKECKDRQITVLNKPVKPGKLRALLSFMGKEQG